MKAEGKKAPHWSWVGQKRKTRGTVGGHARPWSKREQLVNKVFGEIVRSLMKTKKANNKIGHMTTYELAKALGCSQPHASMMLNGRRDVSLTLLWDVAEVFSLAPQDLIRTVDAEISKMEERREDGEYF